MKRPFIVCHMLTSVDGKIDGPFFGAAETAPALQLYGELRNVYQCQATIYGMATILGSYSDGLLPELPPAEEILPKEDYISPYGRNAEQFIVAVDPQGTAAFSSPVMEKKGRPAAHIIEVLTESASPAYLSYLRSIGISYVFAGEKQIHCAVLLEKLVQYFSVDKVMVAGGGIMNESFLQEGLIDELSWVIAPVVDGNTESASLFDKAAFLPEGRPVAFHLKEANVREGHVLWLRYSRVSA
ncbi:dihydrofolate reductase family protein [Megasphaera hexanoica]|nr:dihydrofolate reductase family protein [Megasphaera hexanoica]